MVKLNCQHPGEFIKTNVLPKGMKVIEAAKRLEIGRPALSNMLNGNAALSPELASRIEHVFGASAHELMDMQAAYDTEVAAQRGMKNAPAPYAPPFLQIKANDIVEWADNTLSARSRLPVLLRTLVNSTGYKLTRCEFHGNDDSQRAGHDGYVEAEGATQWIPDGKSWWEFGVDVGVKGKADSDYVKSCGQLTPRERSETTFVFVTPRRWQTKDSWEKSRKEEKKWKNVRVLDASDLEQWLEQSIPAQAWLANELKIDSDGVKSLDACWREWIVDCDPIPDAPLFQSTIDTLHSQKKKILSEPSQPFRIAADSVIEALAFLSCLFSKDDKELFALRDKVVAFGKVGVLTKLAKNAAHFVAIITSPDIEKEFAALAKKPRAIVLYPRNVVSVEPDLTLEPLSYNSFREAFKDSGISSDRIDRLSEESGRSLTVLRRRLSKTPSIQVPEWAQDEEMASLIIPFFFAGAWNKANQNDTAIIELFSQRKSYSELERDVLRLVRIEDSPMWLGGSFRGLVSKMDVLFAIAGWITDEQIKNFLAVAEMVLAEDNPSLDLPEDQQWAAHIYGKKRELSSALRKGVCETLVLFAVYGNQLLKSHIGFDVARRVEMVITNLLTPLTTRRLEAQSDELPMYAEAAPNMFLSVIEEDLETESPQVLGLLRPVNNALFGKCHRSGLLWALEGLAWSKEYFARTVRILGRLSVPSIEDNYVNKPSNSLGSIFRSWMPQTSVPVNERIAALEHLATQYPDVAWRLCKNQFDARSTVGHYSHKPKWRSDGQGFGEPVGHKERYEFVRAALNLAIGWKHHDKKTLGDLVASLRHLPIEDKEAIWDIVEAWEKSAGDDDRSWLREKIRTSALSRRAKPQEQNSEGKENTKQRAREIYNLLSPRDVVLKHEWLFLNSWVDESAEDLEDEEYDYKKREERIASQRRSAIKEVLDEEGVEGIMRLASRGQASHAIGFYLPEILNDSDKLVDFIKLFLEGNKDNSAWRNSLVSGALSSLQNSEFEKMLPNLGGQISEEFIVHLLVLCPFNGSTWNYLKTIDKSVLRDYWENVTPSWSRNTSEELEYAVSQLLKSKRPKSAFELIRLDLSKVQARTLFKVLDGIGKITSEFDSNYALDSYAIRKALKQLNESGELSIDELAGLEFKFIDALEREDGGCIPNLEKQIENNPMLFVQAVAFAYKRRDGKEDPEELRAVDDEHLSQRANASYKLLDALRAIPGHDRYGELASENIVDWVGRVREGCKELGRVEVGDQSIGSLFSHAPTGDDEIWPCPSVRDALEIVMTEHISRGIHTGLYNSRGAHWRGEGGDQEREIAAKYKKWADAVEYSHPKVHKVLMGMVDTYIREAESFDEDAVVSKRLGGL